VTCERIKTETLIEYLQRLALQNKEPNDTHRLGERTLVAIAVSFETMAAYQDRVFQDDLEQWKKDNVRWGELAYTPPPAFKKLRGIMALGKEVKIVIDPGLENWQIRPLYGYD
jgi:hypothetical protein